MLRSLHYGREVCGSRFRQSPDWLPIDYLTSHSCDEGRLYRSLQLTLNDTKDGGELSPHAAQVHVPSIPALLDLQRI